MRDGVFLNWLYLSNYKILCNKYMIILVFVRLEMVVYAHKIYSA